MPVTEFSVGASRTINLGNFESLRVEATVTFVTEAERPEQEQREQAQVELRHLLAMTYQNMMKKNGKTIGS